MAEKSAKINVEEQLTDKMKKVTLNEAPLVYCYFGTNAEQFYQLAEIGAVCGRFGFHRYVKPWCKSAVLQEFTPLERVQEVNREVDPVTLRTALDDFQAWLQERNFQRPSLVTHDAPRGAHMLVLFHQVAILENSNALLQHVCVIDTLKVIKEKLKPKRKNYGLENLYKSIIGNKFPTTHALAQAAALQEMMNRLVSEEKIDRNDIQLSVKPLEHMLADIKPLIKDETLWSYLKNTNP